MVANESLTVAEKPRLYVGCALTDAPQHFRNEVEELKVALTADWRVLKFLGLTDGTPADVYEQDVATNVRGCDAFVGVVDYPATGLGWELGVADERRIPTLIVANAAASITRLVVGAPAHREHISFRTYESMVDDAPTMIREEFARVLTPGR